MAQKNTLKNNIVDYRCLSDNANRVSYYRKLFKNFLKTSTKEKVEKLRIFKKKLILLHLF